MSAAVSRTATTADHGLLPAYIEHCQRLGCSDRSFRDRLRIGRGFLGAHPDLEAWMQRPIQYRLLELRRTGAWPLVVFAIGTGRIRLDLELAATKQLQGLGVIVEAQHPGDFATVRAAGQRLGWTSGWVETVLHGCLAVVLAWTGRTIAELNTEQLQRFEVELLETPTVPRSSARAYRARLASLRQLLYELGIHDLPPRRRPWGGRWSNDSPTLTWPKRSGPHCCVTSPPAPP